MKHHTLGWVIFFCWVLVVPAMGCGKRSVSSEPSSEPAASAVAPAAAPEAHASSLSDAVILDNTWRAMVKNGDGVLTEKDVRSHETFLLMDENGDGKVTRDEFGTLEKREIMLLEKPDKKTLLLIGILDSDSRDLKLSKNEWNAWFEPPQRPYFDKIDFDKDGLITMAELKRFASPHR